MSEEVSGIRLHRFLIIAFSSTYCTWHNFSFLCFIRSKWIVLIVKKYWCLPWILYPIRFWFRLGLSRNILPKGSKKRDWLVKLITGIFIGIIRGIIWKGDLSETVYLQSQKTVESVHERYWKMQHPPHPLAPSLAPASTAFCKPNESVWNVSCKLAL